MSFFVIITLLLMHKKRAELLQQWVTLAQELRGPLGNQYGFAYVMEGLLNPQVIHILLHLAIN